MKLHQSLKSKVCILLTAFVGFSAMAQDFEEELDVTEPQEAIVEEVPAADDSLDFATEDAPAEESVENEEATAEAVPVEEEEVPAIVEAPSEESVPTENLVEVPPQDLPLVEVQIRQDNLAPYKERRETHGVYFGLDYEAVNFKNFISTLDGMSYKDVFGEDTVNLVQAGFDYKFNFFLGSLSAGLFYGMGRVDADNSRSLEISKYGAAFRFTADMIMNEPYVAPYVGLNVWQMGVSEKSATDSFSATTQLGYNYTVGFLIQLDWIDYDTAKESTFNWGLENTFLDVYATQYAKTEAPDDPNTETDFTYGAGLRFEF
ncbi:hypothetical protein EZJ49_05790 [Bdellovibrio bacteriovorus]|uniref:hypothetical protein n=1 Tax=Bdellovibrio bacteriovorus TaxID=959 RepID=UPI0021D2269E|nr:hypothetical protein [Bdellovibrio bacteriovorus]UXR65759.1 hypothetical protein EZJ49_05790 [Bdellovibrio bacteriovorus]